jgi:peptidyl-prolyl cis-trans isomerase A (cyclophilin A)
MKSGSSNRNALLFNAALLLVLSAACQKSVEAPPLKTEPAAKTPAPTPPAKAAAPTPAEPTPAPVAAAADGKKSLNPDENTATAPATFKARFKTSKGDFVVQVTREWAPNGADRFYNLVKNGFFDNTRFFRVISGFMVQWGIHGDPAISAAWRSANIKDDKPMQSNTRGMITFATAGPNTRTTQLFINFGDNNRLNDMGFAPFGKVIEGMDVVDKLYAGYGEGAPNGRGPDQGRLQSQGNAYLASDFPLMDSINSTSVE